MPCGGDVSTRADTSPNKLECENAAAPFIDFQSPRLSWQLGDSRKGAAQTAYQILAANQGVLWDSGKITSSQSLFIPYAGQPLAAAR
ncbi:MAG: hypothetical protein EHM17_12735 [Verrucomicrobiaceae bacterium]|nr:MAG: hypothetical protein EHM17_16060 [Verrucomicrobiaceae bacterium]RPJ32661.1 MAG: hypothetical protein EHM17_12735 [Verrucomicrobiaceae bacterium]